MISSSLQTLASQVRSQFTGALPCRPQLGSGAKKTQMTRSHFCARGYRGSFVAAARADFTPFAPSVAKNTNADVRTVTAEILTSVAKVWFDCDFAKFRFFFITRRDITERSKRKRKLLFELIKVIFRYLRLSHAYGLLHVRVAYSIKIDRKDYYYIRCQDRFQLSS